MQCRFSYNADDTFAEKDKDRGKSLEKGRVNGNDQYVAELGGDGEKETKSEVKLGRRRQGR